MSMCPLRFREYGVPEQQRCIQGECEWWCGDGCAFRWIAVVADAVDGVRDSLKEVRDGVRADSGAQG